LEVHFMGKKKTPKTYKPWKKVPSFEKFVKRKQNAGLSQSEMIYKFRQVGGKIGTTRARQLFNEVTGTTPNPKKSTRIKWYGNDKLNPTQKKYIKDDYMYVLSYKLLDDEGNRDPDADEHFVTISSGVKLRSKADTEILLGQYIDTMNQMGGKYKSADVDWDSVVVHYGVETKKLPKKLKEPKLSNKRKKQMERDKRKK